jgi:HK97 family phage prohead protease/HK97 family phage major capsid protein
MKTKLFHFATTFKAKEDEDGTVKIAGMASTSDTDRAGDVVLPSAWGSGVENYKKNPIILFNHDYSKPIGRVSSISISDKGLSVEAKISSADKEIQQLVKDGVLSTFSVGFMIKEADYLEETDGFLIKEAELFEISVVSVPCNQEATFSVAKSFDNEQEYKDYLLTFKPAEDTAEELAIAKALADKAKEDEEKSFTMEKTMLTPEEIAQMVKDASEKAATETANRIERETQERATKAAEKLAADTASKVKFDLEVKTSAEILVAEVEKRFADKETVHAKDLADLKEDLAAKATEIEAITNSKRAFGDRGANEEEMYKSAEDAFIIGLSTGKGWDTKAGKAFLEKAVNTATGARVPSSEYYETEVSTNIERDIEHALVLAPMFREIQMHAASMVFPVLPDAGYAEFSGTRNALASGTAPNGNLDERSATYGDNAGVDLTQRILSTKKIMSSSFLGNDVEEDAIMPILPLIRESIVRSHARAVEHAIILGNHAQGVYGAGGASFNGLAVFAAASGTNLTSPDATFAAASLTAAQLLTMRKSMGKYGMRANEVVYIINERGYYELIEDSEWQDVNQVGQADSAKLKGSVGKVYGTNIIVCDEFADPAVDVIGAACVNTRNFLMPRLRGLTMESDYEVINQRRVLVSTQRLGFDEVIVAAKSAATLQYPAA